jgi:hypothetical protein
MNEAFMSEYSENRKIPPFFETGTVPAACWAFGEMVRQSKLKKE